MRVTFILLLAAALHPIGCGKRSEAPKAVEIDLNKLANPGPGDPQPKIPIDFKKTPPGGLPRTIDVTEVRNILGQLGRAYHGFFGDRNRGPNDAMELAPYFEKNPKILQALDPKEGYIPFQWKAHLLRMPAGTSNTILAFETIADANGQRNVVMADSSVTQMDEATFQKAPKAGN